MGTLVAQIFEKHLTFEEALRVPGGDAQAPPRPFTRLREDPKLNAFIGATLEEIHERSRKADDASRREKDVRDRAAALGIPVGQSRGGDGRDKTEAEWSYQHTMDPGHDDRKRANETAAVMQEMEEERKADERKRQGRVKYEESMAHPTHLAEVLMLPHPGPAEAVGEAIGHVTGAALNRVGSGGRSGIADDLSKRGGAALGRTTGRAVDAVGSTVMQAAGAAASTIGQGMAEALGFEFDHGPPRGIPKKIQQPPGRLRKNREDL